MDNLNYKYISTDVIASRILKHPLLKDMNYEDIISHIVDVLRLVQVPASYVEESCYINIVDNKAQIPNNALNVKSVDYSNSGRLIAMSMATDQRNTQLHNTKYQDYSGKMTYTLNNNKIHCNFKEGVLFVIFDTLKCDGEGFPMIPDNIPLIKAIENYIKVQVFTVLVDLGKLNQNSLQRAEQEYGWYIGKAQTQFQGFKNVDDLDRFLSDFKRLFPLANTHSSRDRYNINKELRYKNG